MNTYLEKVKEFNDLLGAGRPEKPYIPVDRINLRLELINEELAELKDAIQERNLIEVLDAFIDLQYVLSGAILEFGMGNVFDKAFDKVHDNNMTKFPDNALDCLTTINDYLSRNILVTSKKLNDNKYGIYRVKDDKLVKPINYVPIDLTEFI